MSENIQRTDLQEIEDLLPRIGSSIQKRDLGLALEGAGVAVSRLKEQLDRLESLTETIGMMQAWLQDQDLTQVFAFLREMHDVGQQTSTAVNVSDLSAVGYSWQAIEKTVIYFNQTANKLWQGHCNNEFGTLKPLARVLRALALPASAELSATMDRISSKMEAASKTIADTPSRKSDYRKALEEKQSAIGRLHDLGASDAAIKFLQAVAADEATLGEVTPEILEWLGHSNALSHLRVCL